MTAEAPRRLPGDRPGDYQPIWACERAPGRLCAHAPRPLPACPPTLAEYVTESITAEAAATPSAAFRRWLEGRQP